MARQFIISAIVGALLSSAVQSQESRLAASRERTVESLVQDMYFDTQSSGSLALRGRCEDTPLGSGIVSDVISVPPEGPFKNLTVALAALSRLDAHISWAVDRGGLVRVTDNRVTGELLGIRLKHVRFNAVVTINAAVRAVMSAPEVRSYLAANHIEEFPVFPHGSPVSTEGFPALSDELHDVTVAQALDRIVKYFPGLWIYSECADGSLERVHIRGAVVSWPGKSQTSRPE